MFSHAINQIRGMNISMVISYIQIRHELAFEQHIRPHGIYRIQKREKVCVCMYIYMYKYIYIQKKPIEGIYSKQLSIKDNSSMLLLFSWRTKESKRMQIEVLQIYLYVDDL